MNSDLTFDSFKIVNENQVAFNAANAICKKQLIYNPLWIWGEKDSGKTHLLQAIKEDVSNKNKTAIILDFSDLNLEDINTYILYDYILIDNMQCISTNDSSLNFVPIILKLHEEKKQIVLTSNYLSEELHKIIEIFNKQFKWQFVTDIKKFR